jgi:hypothetical protein
MISVLGWQGVRQACRAGVLAVLALGCYTASADAQRITRWVDENGGLHFTTSPPPPGVKYEMLNLPVARVSVPKAGDETAEETEKAPAAEPAASGDGDARVVLEGKKTETVGPSAREFRGKVKNVGGKRATGVSVRISVFEDGQGNDCLQDTFTVEPPTLRPGETGTYSAVLESPCFFGKPRIDLTPRWAQASVR